MKILSMPRLSERKKFFLAFVLLLILSSLSSCVSATLSDKSALEETPSRAASESEAKRMKNCLRGIFELQKQYFLVHNEYIEKTSRLAVDDACNGLTVTLAPQESGYKAFAKIIDGEESVRWSINEQGKMIEYTDPDMDEDLF